VGRRVGGSQRPLAPGVDRFPAGVAAWNDDELLTPLGPRFPMNAEPSHLDLALHAEREIVHHGAEIALLRDLYPTR
jgi:hypothetical protein